MRAGLVFVLALLFLGGAFREWRRSHEERFQELVESLERRAAEEADREDRSDSTTSGGPRGQEPARSSPRAPSRDLPLGRIDPNRATASDLERLPGIGPLLAARIVADRSSRGAFDAPESLLRVPGIGPRILNRIREHLLFSAARGESLGNF